MIQRDLYQVIRPLLFKGKVIIIYGPRQVGKTTLLEMIIQQTDKKVLFLNCDEPDTRKELSDKTSTYLKQRIGDAEIVLIDEAQRVKNIGLSLKLMVDNISNIQLIITGSSAFELSNEINEPLTGRKFEFMLFPFSTAELIKHTDSQAEQRVLERRLVYGMYPDVVNNPGLEQKILNNLTSSYLYKDIFSFQDVRKPELLESLLESLPLQLGSEVSYHELGLHLRVDQLTIRRYLDLLEKSFVIFRLRAFSRNLRHEIKKSRKIYFYDNGIRNAIISQFAGLNLRTDMGALWENFLVSERYKLLNNNQIISKQYFWRTQQQQEIDYIEEKGASLSAFEFKYNQKGKIPKTFVKAYPDAQCKIINSENYLEFLT